MPAEASTTPLVPPILRVPLAESELAGSGRVVVCVQIVGGYVWLMADATRVPETERKYETDDIVELNDLAEGLGARPGAGERVPGQRLVLEAVYFDTDDLRLLRAGVTLRRREGGSDAGWHLKLPAGTDTREEIQLPLSTDRLNPPAELVALIRVHTRGAPLSPVAQLNTERRSWTRVDDRGRKVLDLVEDQVHAHTLGAQTRAMSWREIEVELGERGGVGELDEVERRLRTIGVRRSGTGSKLARVLGQDLDLSPQPVPGKGGSAGAVVLEYVAAQAEVIRRHDPGARRDAEDAVHKMRVAVRRMRSALQAFGRVIDRDRTRGLIAELKWLGRELAPARDNEVIHHRLVELTDQAPDDLVLGPVSAHTERVMQRRHAEGHRGAVAVLDSDRYLRLHDAIEELLRDPPLRARARRAARTELPRGVARAHARTVTRMRTARKTPSGPGRDEALHETRKAAKRLRYAAEVARPAVGKPAKRFIKALKKVHTLLGDHQDAVVARPVLRELAVQAHLDGGNGFTYGLLHASETARAQHAEHGLPARWKRLTTHKNTRWFAR